MPKIVFRPAALRAKTGVGQKKGQKFKIWGGIV
jgi:hypothetical protein